MTDEETKKWRELTFSQREGKVPLPESLQAGKLSSKFKNRIWLFVEKSLRNCTYISTVRRGQREFKKSSEGDYWKKCYFSYHFDTLDIPHTEIYGRMRPVEVKQWFKDIILESESHEVITVVEHILRTSGIPKDLDNNIGFCFELAPYLIDRSSEPLIIIPTTSEEMKASIKNSLENINKSELTGAKSHIRKAAQRLRENDFGDSMRESISAVEAAARQLDPKASKTLAPALDSLENHKMLKHPALKDAFKKLYGYTSDTKGIRHSLFDQGTADVGFDEAIFMYAACVSFVDYLASKQRQIEEK